MTKAKPAMKDMGKLWNEAIKLGDVKVEKYYQTYSSKPTLMCRIKYSADGDEVIGIAHPPQTIANAMQKAINKAINKQSK